MARKKTKVIRILPSVHKGLTKLAALERRDLTDVADRLLAKGIASAIVARDRSKRVDAYPVRAPRIN